VDKDNTTRANVDRPDGRPSLGRGASLGRYLILGLLGRGAMGEVYAAYDPELDRKIALKLLQARRSSGIDVSEGRARLLREAQAIARLSDPNVVVIFDVGTFGDRVFLAMEFVDGSTLASWLKAQPRTWREVVAIFMAAGSGLASAHRAGLVHRDFKPDNVMIGRDGKVRVMDFGLARTIGSEGRKSRELTLGSVGAAGPGPASGPASSSASGSAPASGTGSASASLPTGPSFEDPGQVGMAVWSDADTAIRNLSDGAAGLTLRVPRRLDIGSAGPDPLLTATGAIRGTPAYMAPEQFLALPNDAATDQFSFCVALYEGLFGQRPFPGRTVQELSANVIAGRLRPAPPAARIPRWLRRVVLRGLRVDGRDRHPSMEALLAELAREPGRARRRWAATLAVVGLVALLGVGLVRAERQQRTRCLGTDSKLAGVWELPVGGGLSPRKQAIRRAFLATGKRYAGDAFNFVSAALDRYVTEWSDMRRDSCEATNVRGEQSAEVLDLRASCLDERFAEVRALTAVFNEANGDVVSKSVQAVTAIRPVAPCADIAGLRAVVRPPEDPAVRRRVADIRASLAEAAALENAGKYSQASQSLPGLVVAARATGYRPVVAEALLWLAKSQDLAGANHDAEKSYDAALWTAEGARHDEVAAEAAVQLVGLMGAAPHRAADVERWSEQSRALLERLGPGHDLLAGWRANNLAVTYMSEGKIEAALAADREALSLKARALGERHFDVGITLMNMALASYELGRVDEAVETNQRAMSIFRQTVGLDHPYAATCLSNGAEYANQAGRFSEAQDMAERALRIWEPELGAEHPYLAFPLTALGWSLIEQGRPKAALPHLERALSIRLARDQDPKGLGDTRFALARALWEAGGADERALQLAGQARLDFADVQGAEARTARLDSWARAPHPHPHPHPELSQR
jgi:serine/threonine protein kinase/tetratricopeptide (TPR) repeat protein